MVAEGFGDIETAAWWSTMGTLVTATCANDIHELHVVGRGVLVLLIVMVRFEGRERRGGCVWRAMGWSEHSGASQLHKLESNAMPIS